MQQTPGWCRWSLKSKTRSDCEPGAKGLTQLWNVAGVSRKVLVVSVQFDCIIFKQTCGSGRSRARSIPDYWVKVERWSSRDWPLAGTDHVCSPSNDGLTVAKVQLSSSGRQCCSEAPFKRLHVPYLMQPDARETKQRLASVDEAGGPEHSTHTLTSRTSRGAGTTSSRAWYKAK
eukprot:27049-Rhodomonas_salina.4